MSDNYAEKRKSIRVPVNFPASFSKDNRHYLGIVLNLSADGLFIRTQQQFDSEDRLDFSFQLPGSNSSLHVRGTVAWGAGIHDGPDRLYGLGVRFQDVAPDQASELNSYIEKLLKS